MLCIIQAFSLGVLRLLDSTRVNSVRLMQSTSVSPLTHMAPEGAERGTQARSVGDCGGQMAADGI